MRIAKRHSQSYGKQIHRRRQDLQEQEARSQKILTGHHALSPLLCRHKYKRKPVANLIAAPRLTNGKGQSRTSEKRATSQHYTQILVIDREVQEMT